MELFNKIKHFRFGNVKAKATRAPFSVQGASETESLPATDNLSGSQEDIMSIDSDRWEEFRRNCDQRLENIMIRLLSSGPTSIIQRTKVLCQTLKLRVHQWTLICEDEKYRSLYTPEEWDEIRQNLEFYSKEIPSLELECSKLEAILARIQELQGSSIASLQEGDSQEQGDVKGWPSRFVATIVMMMGPREITPLMAKRLFIIGLAVMSATTAMHLMLVAWLWWASGM